MKRQRPTKSKAFQPAKLLPGLAEKLTAHLGRGLHKKKPFYLAFPVLDAPRPKLSGMQYCIL